MLVSYSILACMKYANKKRTIVIFSATCCICKDLRPTLLQGIHNVCTRTILRIECVHIPVAIHRPPLLFARLAGWQPVKSPPAAAKESSTKSTSWFLFDSHCDLEHWLG